MSIRLGYIGLGIMGGPMVDRLLEAGHDVLVWNRSREKILPALDKGAKEAASVAELVSNVDVVLMCLTDSKAVEIVVFGEGGVASVGSKDKLLVDFSSMRPDVTRELAARLKSETGMGWVDAPVSGGAKGAVAGTLAIMAGGAEADIERVRPIVEAFSQRFTRMGESGAGQVTKLCNQIIVASNVVTMAEAVSFAEKSGVVDATKLAEALKGGWADSQPFQIMAPRFAARNTEPKIGAANTMLKDLDTARDVALENGAPVPMAALASEAFRKLSSMGLGEEDIGEIMALFDPRDEEG
ncbi:MAG: NAD(P)-dependent oxidoreductase [Rhodospirillaceae bacterium]|jgi:3-hydroxyisobutyrate dehydrogenase|nr:NAD(P)-dependent oxidoreductase [Rhodospirillaceae bacterium]MBT4589805.1 NAD(P)-dependent oxidoreductase [Rhodospirillaceae bacterium]MBT5941983.1 NAD(P)-dependent oxidoreductase [Rhodospirillaceae bacterium]MBT7268198.1 NAD(P)-dependent oxidoreductase [Rhodospirillaceae bacterium]